MSKIISTIETKCVFCGRDIHWDAEFMACPECEGSGNDPYNGVSCPYCGGDGFIDADEYLPCCDICFEQEYNELLRDYRFIPCDGIYMGNEMQTQYWIRRQSASQVIGGKDEPQVD